MSSSKENSRNQRFEKINEILNDNFIEKLLDTAKEFDPGEEFPGSIELTLDPMKMKAYLEIKAPKNSSSEITYDDIKESIYKSEIERSNIEWETVEKIFLKVIIKNKNCPRMLIAKGHEVKPHIPEHIIPKSSLSVDYRPIIERDGKVDHHHINSFITVKKYEYLAELIPDQPGEDGRTLFGKTIPHPTIVRNNLTCGDNLYISSSRIYSSIDGTYKVVKDKITVDPCLNIESDVNYETGDLEFSGDIDIEGSVREGFNVKSKGDIRVDHSIEPSTIECGNNLYVNEGIWGSPEKVLNCNGDIFSGHIENAFIKAAGTLHITNSILNSNISSLDKLVMPKKSQIIGGKISCQNGIVTGSIGSKLGTETKIYLGIDYVVEEKLTLIQKNIVTIIDEMKGLQSSLKVVTNREDKDKIKELHIALRNRLNSLVNHSKVLLSKLDRNDRSTLEAYGKVFPGTYIEICHISYVVTEELSMVKFYLRKELGEIQIQSIS